MNSSLCRHPASLRGSTQLGGASSRRPVAAGGRSLVKASATSTSQLPRLQPLDGEWTSGRFGIPYLISESNFSLTPPLSAFCLRLETYEEWHRFSTYSNWLVPGAVMVGRYGLWKCMHGSALPASMHASVDASWLVPCIVMLEWPLAPTQGPPLPRCNSPTPTSMHAVLGDGHVCMT